MIFLKARISYVQMTFGEFVSNYPELAKVYKNSLPADILFDEFLNDKKYLVRVSGDRIEVGYSDDAWTLE